MFTPKQSKTNHLQCSGLSKSVNKRSPVTHCKRGLMSKRSESKPRVFSKMFHNMKVICQYKIHVFNWDPTEQKYNWWRTDLGSKHTTHPQFLWVNASCLFFFFPGYILYSKVERDPWQTCLNCIKLPSLKKNKWHSHISKTSFNRHYKNLAKSGSGQKKRSPEAVKCNENSDHFLHFQSYHSFTQVFHRHNPHLW